MESEKPRILIVDDEKDNLKALERTLRGKFEVFSTTNPLEALELVKTVSFFVVLSDQRMPQMLGTHLLAEVAKIDPMISRVILTAYTETSEMLDAINKAEIHRYIVKPWDNDELVLALEQAAERSRLKKENYYLLKSLEKKNIELLQREEELKKLNEKLEVLVEERTQELKIANEKLSQLAITDSLTGVFNRRAIFDFLNQELRRSVRYMRPIVVVMIDVDHFKPFNDTEGHVFGDQALKKLTEVLRKNLRTTDILGRYGGEEFLLIMPETSISSAIEICDRLRSIVEKTEFNGKNGIRRLTISMGLAGFPEKGKTAEELINIADKSLYEAKRQGRNKVIAA